MKKVTLKIEGMHCASCAINIDGDLEEKNGVIASNTNYAKQESTVEFDESNVKLEDIVNQITETGYTAIVKE